MFEISNRLGVLNNRESQAVPLEDCQKDYGRVIRSASLRRSRCPWPEDPGVPSRRRSHPPVRCRDLGSLQEADQAIWAVSSTLLVLHPWHQMARLRVKRRGPQESKPAQHGVHLASGTAALGLATPKAVFFIELQEGKRDRGAPRKRCKRPTEERARCLI